MYTLSSSETGLDCGSVSATHSRTLKAVASNLIAYGIIEWWSFNTFYY